MLCSKEVSKEMWTFFFHTWRWRAEDNGDTALSYLHATNLSVTFLQTQLEKEPKWIDYSATSIITHLPPDEVDDTLKAFRVITLPSKESSPQSWSQHTVVGHEAFVITEQRCFKRCSQTLDLFLPNAECGSLTGRKGEVKVLIMLFCECGSLMGTEVVVMHAYIFSYSLSLASFL